MNLVAAQHMVAGVTEPMDGEEGAACFQPFDQICRYGAQLCFAEVISNLTENQEIELSRRNVIG
jgi:hypothetical protein